MFAQVRDTRLFFDIEGLGWVVEGPRLRDRPVAVLLHGGPGADHSSYKPTFSSLAEVMQLIYLDHRGQGRSARGARRSYTLENNVEDLEALRQYLGLERWVVIGGSYGGMVALAYASRYPERVSQLIVYATAADYRFLERAQANLAARGTSSQQAIAEHLWAGTFRDEAHLREYFRLLAPLYSHRYQPDPSEASWERAILSVDAINEAFSGFLRHYDLRSQLPRITAPTLVIAGRHDWICPPECSEEFTAMIPGARLDIFEQSGHSIRADEPQQLLTAIANFVTSNLPHST